MKLRTQWKDVWSLGEGYQLYYGKVHDKADERMEGWVLG